MTTTIGGRTALILTLLGSLLACKRNENLEQSSIDPAAEPELFADFCSDNQGEDTPSWRFRVRFNNSNVPRLMLMNGTSNKTETWGLCPSSKVTWLARKKFEICFDEGANPVSPFDPEDTLCVESTEVSATKHRVGPLTVRADADEQAYKYRVCFLECDGRNPQWDPVIIVEK